MPHNAAARVPVQAWSRRRSRVRRPARHDGGRFPRVALLVLAGGIFLSMTSEFLPGGLIPDIASTFDRPIGDVGQLITVFAATVILATAPLAAVTRRVPRKALAVIALTVICMAGAGAALSPTFELLMASRALGGAAHGLFWVVAAAYAADLVPRSELARASVITATGGSLASILGVPAGNALGQMFGWRMSFLALALIGVFIVALVAVMLPPLRSSAPAGPHRPMHMPDHAGRRVPASTMPGILLVCAIILLVVIGQTTIGSYSVVWLTDVAALPPTAVPLYLLATGAAALLAVAMVGRLADTHPKASALGATAGAALLTALLPFAARWGVTVMMIVAIAQAMCFAVVPPLLQTRMMHVAAPHQRVTAAALQTTAFNIAIGGGAVIGGVFTAGIGLPALPWAGAALTAVGLCMLLLLPPPSDRAATVAAENGSSS